VTLGFSAGFLFEDAKQVGLAHDQKGLAFDLDFGPAPLAVQHLVTRLDVESGDLAVIAASTGAGGDDFALLRLFLGGVRNDDAASSLVFARSASRPRDRAKA